MARTSLVTFWWDKNDICFVLEQKTELDFYSASWENCFFIHFPIESYYKTLFCAEGYLRLKTNIIHDHLRNIPNHWYNISIPYDVASEKRFEILVIHKESIIDPWDHVDLPKSDKIPVKMLSITQVTFCQVWFHLKSSDLWGK